MMTGARDAMIASMDLNFALKREDCEEDASFEDIDNLLSIPIPSLSKKFLVPNDPNDEFLRLTTMVRAVYFSYLHKCLLNNYIYCYKERSEDVPSVQLKRCADELEQNAVRYSLEASLYRQQMLKLISEVKSHTSERKAYKKLVIYLESQDRVDVAVQTDNSWAELERLDNIQSVCITSNCEELSGSGQRQWSDDEETVRIGNRQDSPASDKEDSTKAESPESLDLQEILSVSDTDKTATFVARNRTASPTVNSTSLESERRVELNVDKAEFVGATVKEEIQVTAKGARLSTMTDVPSQDQSVRFEDENSQDSILQHMEDMFCESDDSSDLTTLIERHSGVSKARLDKEITRMSQSTEPLLMQNLLGQSQSQSQSQSQPPDGPSPAENGSRAQPGSVTRFSLADYREMRAKEKVKVSEPETPECKLRRRAHAIWFVERVHQMSRLKSKMTELSLKNYRKYGRVKEKFVELFGESDDEERMPDSPICIEEHLTACKERIAPWIVKQLMPLYKKRRIKDRQLFKAVAKHIADMLIIEDTFPEQDSVSRYIEAYFKNKKTIKTKQDIYL